MRRIKLTIAFTDDDGTTRSETQDVETTYEPDVAGEHRVAHLLFAEMKVTVGDQTPPRHNTTARQWLDFPKRSSHLTQYFDIRNSQALWFELSNLVLGVESDLALSEAFKALEPAQEPSFDDDVALNDLYYIHDRKLTLLNQSVYGLVKVQDLVNRLLHESLGGDLVDTSGPNWEEETLRRKNVINGLNAKRATGLISRADCDAITDALNIPRNIPKGEIARNYRNRLMHHIRPSVDYSMFFSVLESRAGEELKDAQGIVIGKRHTLPSKTPVDLHFYDLHGAFSDYLDAVVSMLQKLGEIEILRR